MKTSPFAMRIQCEHWPLLAPFRIAGRVYTGIDVVVVQLNAGDVFGLGEARGVPYLGETAAALVAQLESIRGAIERRITRAKLQTLLPAGGARNALDCALWDIEAKLSGNPVWIKAGVQQFKPLETVITVSADTPRAMASAARLIGSNNIKIKLTGEPLDEERLRAVRDARPGAWLMVDANQAFTIDTLGRIMPSLEELGIALIEQPLATACDKDLDSFRSPIPLMADESIQTVEDLNLIATRFQVVNIKLDKAGGLTGALALLHAARNRGLKTWAGNMFGTSLAMAPAFVLAQLCDFVELDGPVFLAEDRDPGIDYVGGQVTCPQTIWGFAGRGVDISRRTPESTTPVEEVPVACVLREDPLAPGTDRLYEGMEN